MSEQPYLDAIQATYAELEHWQLRGRRPDPERPEAGSDLALDDLVFRPHPISEVARLSLVVSGEHMRLARDAIEAGQLYPSAHFTTLRGALVGAAQAVWILAPGDSATRRDRGLTVIAEMYTQLGKHYSELSGFDLSPEKRSELASQSRWLAERKEALAAVREKSASLNQTAMIHWALDYRFKDAERREDGRVLWRQMSGDAHVLGWGLFQRALMGPEDRRSGLAVGQAGGSLQAIAQPFMAAFLLLKEGWSIFDGRCVQPAP